MGSVKGPAVALALLALIQVACSIPSLPGAPTTVTLVAPTAVGPCGWVWASSPLPDLSAQVQAALDDAGISAESARAAAYGENCIDAETNEVRRFAAMQTDFHVTLPVDDAEDLEALGDSAASVLAVLDGFPPNETPGPRSGQVGITFVAGDEQVALWFTYLEGVKARDQGLGGPALMEALGH